MTNNLHVLQIVGEPVGGIRKHVHSLLLGLSDRGVRQSYAYSTSLCDLAFTKELPKLREVLGGRLLPLHITKKPGFRDIANLLKLRRYIKVNRITVVHGHGAKGGAYARLLKKLCGVKAVYTPHGGAIHRMFGPAEELLYSFAEKRLFSLTDYFLFESKYSAEGYFSKVCRVPGKWGINYSGIPEPDIRAVTERAKSLGLLQVPNAIPRAGVFGILRSQKGQRYAVRAAAILSARGVKLELHFYGSGPDRESLEAEARKAQLAGRVFFHGQVADPEVYMSAMDIVLIPSVFESFGYVAVEAFSLHKPVVAAAVGGLTEILDSGVSGILVPSRSAEKMADALELLIKDPQKASEYGENGYRKYTADFGIDKMLQGVARVYSAL